MRWRFSKRFLFAADGDTVQSNSFNQERNIDLISADKEKSKQ